MSDSETIERDLPETTDSEDIGNQLVNFSDKIQMSSTPQQVSKCTIVDTEFRQSSSGWYDIVKITFKHSDGSKTHTKYPISPNNNYIDDHLDLLYNYLNKEPNNISENTLLGEKVPSVYNGKRWYVFIPTNFSSESQVMTSLLYSRFSDSSRSEPKIDRSFTLFYIVGLLGLFGSLILSNIIILIICLIYVSILFLIQNKGFKGIKI